VLAFAPGLPGVLGGVVLWGLHIGFTQGLLATLVAEAAPPELLRGTGLAMFRLETGIALLAASVLAGALWDAFGSQGTFLAGAGFALLAMASLIPLHRRLTPKKTGRPERQLKPCIGGLFMSRMHLHPESHFVSRIGWLLS
jgi:MFS family permease